MRARVVVNTYPVSNSLYPTAQMDFTSPTFSEALLQLLGGLPTLADQNPDRIVITITRPTP